VEASSIVCCIRGMVNFFDLAFLMFYLSMLLLMSLEVMFVCCLVFLCDSTLMPT